MRSDTQRDASRTLDAKATTKARRLARNAKRNVTKVLDSSALDAGAQ